MAVSLNTAKSSLCLPLRHPAKPIQSTRPSDIDTDVNPQEPKISPSVGKVNTDRFQERSRILDRAVLADTRGCRIHNIAACGAYVFR